jgi:hypothetical protein
MASVILFSFALSVNFNPADQPAALRSTSSLDLAKADAALELSA